MLRLCSRILGMVFAMTLILIGGEKIGLPLVGLIAGHFTRSHEPGSGRGPRAVATR